VTDRAHDEIPLRDLCTSLGHRIAVAGGCLVALLSLLNHVRVSTAAVRGGLTFLAVLLVARWGFAALCQAHALDEAERNDEEESAE